MAKRGNEVAVSKGNLVERIPRPIHALSGFSELDRLFDDFFGRRWMRPFGDLSGFEPDVDIIDRDDEIVVRAALPGFKKDDIEVSVSGTTLTLSGHTSAEEKEEKGSYYRAEIVRGSFMRTIALPAEVDDDNAKAAMRDGVLELTLPKVEKSKRRTISIS